MKQQPVRIQTRRADNKANFCIEDDAETFGEHGHDMTVLVDLENTFDRCSLRKNNVPEAYINVVHVHDISLYKDSLA